MSAKKKADKGQTEPISEQDFNKFTNELKTIIQQSQDKMNEGMGMMKEANEKIDSRLKNIEVKFASIVKELREEIQTVKDEVEIVKSDVDDAKVQMTNVSEQVDGIEKSLEFHVTKIEEVDRKLDEKKQELENKKLLTLEKHDRKYNLIFNGIEEEVKERLYDKMRHFFCDDLKIERSRALEIQFVNGHRLLVDAKHTGPKPIIMRFACYEHRELVLSQAFKLAGSGKTILTDLPVPMKKERQRLAKTAYGIRKGEKLKTRIRDKGLDMVLETRADDSESWVIRKV